MRRRLAATGLTVLASLALATTACTQAPGSVTPSATAKPATEVLTEAAAKTKGQSFKYTLTYGTQLTGDGARDASGANALRNITFTDAASGMVIKANVLVTADTLYVKVDLGPLTASIPGMAGLAGKWMTVDRTKIGTSGLAASLVPGGDSLTAESFIKGVVSAEKVSDTEIKGTIDLGKSAPSIIQASEIATLTPETKIVPFTATLDGEGRIIKIVINMPKVGDYAAADLTTNYTDYNAPVEVTKPPAADTVAAPEMIYLFLQ